MLAAIMLLVSVLPTVSSPETLIVPGLSVVAVTTKNTNDAGALLSFRVKNDSDRTVELEDVTSLDFSTVRIDGLRQHLTVENHCGNSLPPQTGRTILIAGPIKGKLIAPHTSTTFSENILLCFYRFDPGHTYSGMANFGGYVIENGRESKEQFSYVVPWSLTP